MRAWCGWSTANASYFSAVREKASEMMSNDGWVVMQLHGHTPASAPLCGQFRSGDTARARAWPNRACARPGAGGTHDEHVRAGRDRTWWGRAPGKALPGL